MWEARKGPALEKDSCRRDIVFDAPLNDRETLVEKTRAFFAGLPPVADRSCTDRTCIMRFGLDDEQGRTNAAKLLMHTLHRSRCESQTTRDHRRQVAFEVLQFVAVVLLAWRIVRYVAPSHFKLRTHSFTARALLLLEAAIGLLVGVSLFLRFDTTLFFAERISLRAVLRGAVALVLVGGACAVASYPRHRVCALGASACLLLALVAALRLSSAHLDTNVRHAANRTIGRVNAHMGLRAPALEKWRMTAPTFTDNLFISTAATLLILYGVDAAIRTREPDRAPRGGPRRE